MYEKNFMAGWGDVDFNAHMKNTAYLDRSGDVRLLFFAEHGLPISEFLRLRMGPVVMKDEVEYFKEINMLEEYTVNVINGGLAPDGSRFIVHNEFYKAGNKLAARVTSHGGWLDLTQRKLIPAPEKLLADLNTLPKSENYVELPSSVR